MAGPLALAALGASLERVLTGALAGRFANGDDDGLTGARAVLITSNDFGRVANPNPRITPPCLTIFPYRVDLNFTMRAAWSAVGHADGFAHLPVDLRFLLSSWADDPVHQLSLLGVGMQALELTPSFRRPVLDARGEWEANESIQVVVDEISTEAVMRTFDSLESDYQLSVPYVARIVRLSQQERDPVPPVQDSTFAVAALAGQP